ncbi:hypothetical protein ABZ990_10980 [Streptomyces sp. NPDC046203]|uniref:hypothetical protein n=1 Tax=Streptomyces sp. NPDC046203 TaxID=3154602 RepID=UPI0034103CB2
MNLPGIDRFPVNTPRTPRGHNPQEDNMVDPGRVSNRIAPVDAETENGTEAEEAKNRPEEPGDAEETEA